jgi:antitoxin (DNA-binding transcriptional repressor) of toxin-antitoxin stability system
MPRMTATDAARRFSEVLNRVASGEAIDIVRNGAPVATIGPPRVRLVSAERFREVMATAPRPDAEFARDVRALRDRIEAPADPWPS